LLSRNAFRAGRTRESAEGTTTTPWSKGVRLSRNFRRRGGHKTPEHTAHERSRAFKQGQRFRAGIEGRIAVLLRGPGLRRCLLEGRQRFEVFVGAAVLANNLLRIAALRQRRRARPARAA